MKRGAILSCFPLLSNVLCKGTLGVIFLLAILGDNLEGIFTPPLAVRLDHLWVCYAAVQDG